MTNTVIVAAKRTAIGNFLGGLKTLPAHELGSVVIKQLLCDTQIDPTLIDEVIMGQILTAAAGQNPARQAAITAGIGIQTPAITINKLCGSGMKAIHMAAQAIMCGDADIIVAGGQESMSQAPHVLTGGRNGWRMGDAQLQDTMILDGLTCAINGYHMGITAENIAKQFTISREAQDAFALDSQHTAACAQRAGKFANEIVPVSVPQRANDPIIVDQDEGIHHDLEIASLAKMRPAFDHAGSVTVGNASGINDGAAAVIVMSEHKAAELGLAPLARIVAYATAGVDPAIMGTGPIPATRTCLARAGWHLAELEVIEANEAFAAQAIAVNQQLDWDSNIVNVNGGAIALGHPVGASGARIVATLIHVMIDRNAHKGLATMCIGGGQGIAIAIQR